MRLNPLKFHRLNKKSGLRSRKGYVVIATLLGLTFLLGSVGLGVDIGRMYIAKSEAQAFVDSAALAAASKLDGKQTGIDNAKTAISSNTGKWRFDTSTFSNVATTFATDPNGTYTANPDPPTDYNYVKVVASVDLPMYLIQVLAGSSANISASAIAGHAPLTTIRRGVFPFSPYIRTGTFTDSKG